MKAPAPFCLALAGFLAAANPGYADDKSHKAAAEDCLKAMKVEALLESTIEQSIDVQIKANPAIAQYKPVMLKFFKKHMGWDGMKDDMIGLYTDAFTEAELKELATFYRSKVGQKLVQKTPELTGKGMQLGMKKVQDNQAELRKMIEEEKDK